jgi:predicted kinase
MRRVIIMSGVSGSGKSTYIRNNITPLPTVFSADDYFIKDGKYNFEPSKLGDAHATCFRHFMHACQIGICSPIVVDNTNLSAYEIAPYILGANAFDLVPEIITMDCRNSAEWYARRNTHNVPVETIRLQLKRLASRVLPPYWKNKVVQTF